MHEDLRRAKSRIDPSALPPTSTSVPELPLLRFESKVKPLFYSQKIEDVTVLAMKHQGYLLKHGPDTVVNETDATADTNMELWSYSIPSSLEYLRVDMEYAKLEALQLLLKKHVKFFDLL